jgi:hypothetical protein
VRRSWRLPIVEVLSAQDNATNSQSSSPRLPHSDGFRQSGFAEILLSVSRPLSNSDRVAEEIYRDAS